MNFVRSSTLQWYNKTEQT